MEGRWTILVCKDCGQRAHYQDRCPKDRRRVWTEMVEVPVVPCDDAAIERGARVLFADYSSEHETTWEQDRDAFMAAAEAVLRAAGETTRASFMPIGA